MIHIRGHVYRRFWKANFFQRTCTVPIRRFHSATDDTKPTHSSRTTGFEDKPSIHDYYSRREIAALFLQPFCIIVAYLLVVWQIFKWHCNINGIDDFLRTLRWKYRTYQINRKEDED